MATAASLPAYCGSMLRGCLGAQLRKGLCMTRGKDCKTCMLGKSCIFPKIFNPSPARGEPVPPPFCIEPPLAEKSAYEPGDSFIFNLKLFSYGVDYFPFFVQAFRMAGEHGVGNPNKPARFALEKIICAGKNIYNAAEDDLSLPEADILSVAPVSHAENRVCELTLHLLTPLRHKSGNHFSATLDFGQLFHLVLRRIRNLYLCEGAAWKMEPEKYLQLKEAAAKISIGEKQLRWHDWTRYSARQDAAMKLGGLTGKITYCGDFAIFSNLLQFAQIAHIGKQTSFGLGNCQMEYNNLR